MDNHYQEPALVEIYDAVNASRDDFNFYIAQLPKAPAHILDIGCGTGTLALELAQRGFAVIGVDPAPEMIAAARIKQGSDAVDWITGLVSDVPPSSVVDVAIMTGHAFQCLLQDDEIDTLFHSVALRLVHGGSFWFETRNADAQPWKNWTPEHAGPPITLSNERRVQVTHRVLEVEGEYVSFEETYEFGNQNDPLISKSTLRFPPLEKIQQIANKNGLSVRDAFGDWEKNAIHKDSPEIILRLERSE